MTHRTRTLMLAGLAAVAGAGSAAPAANAAPWTPGTASPPPASGVAPNPPARSAAVEPAPASRVVAALDIRPEVPGPITIGETTQTRASLCWAASSNPAVVSYHVTVDGKTTDVRGLCTTITGLIADSEYAVSVVGVDDRDAKGPAATSWFRTKPSAVVDRTPRRYTISGTTEIKTLTKGAIPLTGALAVEAVTAWGAVTADLELQSARGRLIALGFIPVTAKVAFVPSGKTTGHFSDGTLSTMTLVRITLPEVKLFGAIPLAGGSNCQTKQPSTVRIASPSAFAQSVGGGLAGTFAISDLDGCGVLNGLVSPLTAGGGNTIDLRLTAVPGR